MKNMMKKRGLAVLCAGMLVGTSSQVFPIVGEIGGVIEKLLKIGVEAQTLESNLSGLSEAVKKRVASINEAQIDRRYVPALLLIRELTNPANSAAAILDDIVEVIANFPGVKGKLDQALKVSNKMRAIVSLIDDSIEVTLQSLQAKKAVSEGSPPPYPTKSVVSPDSL